MNFIKKLFGIKKHTRSKKTIPIELQTQLMLGTKKFSKFQLLSFQEEYELDTHTYNTLAMAFRHIEEYEIAEEMYLESIELCPTNENPYSNLLSLYILQKK